MKFKGSLARIYPDLRFFEIVLQAGKDQNKSIVPLLQSMHESAFTQRARKTFGYLTDQIVGGWKLSEALKSTKAGAWDNPVVISTIVVGETGEALEEAVKNLADLAQAEAKVVGMPKLGYNKKKVANLSLWLRMFYHQQQCGTQILQALENVARLCDADLKDITLNIRAQIREGGDAVYSAAMYNGNDKFFIEPVILILRLWQEDRSSGNPQEILLRMANLLEELANS